MYNFVPANVMHCGSLDFIDPVATISTYNSQNLVLVKKYLSQNHRKMFCK